MVKAVPTILEAMADPDLFGPMFAGPSWDAWRAVLAGLFALPMDEDTATTFTTLTQRDSPPTTPCKEAWIIAGRRSGKTHVAGLIASYVAAFVDFRPYLSAGEKAMVLVLAVDRSQARVCFDYLKALFTTVPALRTLVARETSEELELTTGVTIAVHSNSFRSVRGRTVAVAIFDESAYWRSDLSAVPDQEVYRAVLPSMATIPTRLLLGISSPYARHGLLWKKHQQHYGKTASPVLVVKAPSRDLNPTLDQELIDAELQEDPAAASAEWLAEFRSDLAAFLDPELLDPLTRGSPLELPPQKGIAYAAFADPSGGRGDAFTIAIGHREEKRTIVDVVRATKSPFNPAHVVAGYSALLKDYGLRTVMGDRYAANWVSEAFAEHAIRYHASPLAKSDLYIEALPAFTRAEIELPPDKRLLAELTQLERRTSRAGRDTVDHPVGGHDDAANAACGMLFAARQAQGAALPVGWARQGQAREGSQAPPVDPRGIGRVGGAGPLVSPRSAAAQRRFEPAGSRQPAEPVACSDAARRKVDPASHRAVGRKV